MQIVNEDILLYQYVCANYFNFLFQFYKFLDMSTNHYENILRHQDFLSKNFLFKVSLLFIEAYHLYFHCNFKLILLHQHLHNGVFHVYMIHMFLLLIFYLYINLILIFSQFLLFPQLLLWVFFS
jgi:hypothetical protein